MAHLLRDIILGLKIKPDIYSVHLIQQPVICLQYRTYATIIAVISSDIEIANKMLLKYAISGNFELIEILINQGADINIWDVEGRNCLIEAISNGHAKIGILLVDKGIDVHKKDNFGDNALSISDILNRRKN